ncbi:hypothetical protein PISMIDRAFT_115486, partial [Pisolithus microcarpus 441]
ILTGHALVFQLMNGHPNHIGMSIGISLEAFSTLINVLNQVGIVQWDGISVEGQLGIFLYTFIIGLSLHLLSEQFQHSTDTVTR